MWPMLEFGDPALLIVGNETFSSLVHLARGGYLWTLVEAVLGA